MVLLALVFLGGGVGSLARYAISAYMSGNSSREGAFPAGTLAVNLVGCLTIGLLAGWCAKREWARSLLIVGLLGGFTTYSAFGLDAARLLLTGHPGRAMLYVGISVIGGVGASVLALRMAGGLPN